MKGCCRKDELTDLVFQREIYQNAEKPTNKQNVWTFL